MSIKQISLYYKDGGSDKVYHAQIEEKDGLYLVNFQYGRRGSTLTAGTKTKDPVSLEAAEKAYNSIIKEKTSKGYTEGESGAIFQSQDLEDRITGIVPQLLNDIDEEGLEKCLSDDNWIMQEKMDGRRLLTKKVGSEFTAINKKGLSILIPEIIVNKIKEVEHDIVLDGEIIGERYYIFDVLEHKGQDLRKHSVKSRYDILTAINEINHWVVPAYFQESEKRSAFQELKEKEKEGAVFKKMDAEYVSGRPASGGNQLKYKFWASATVVVNSIHKTKRSVGVSVYKDGEEVKVGNVTIPPNYDMPKIGDIVEVIYLYCHVKGALYQSKYKGLRDDQNIDDCTYNQLKFKAVEEEEE